MAKTLNTFILDKSSSMTSIYSATVEAFNTYVQTLRNNKGDEEISFTLVQFSTDGIERTWFEKPVDEVPLLSKDNYKPLGGTPLIDAVFNTIQALQAAVDKKKAAGEEVKVIVCIQTDGEENSSREHSWADLKELIASKQAAGWQFNFMGAGIDAYQQAAAMGLSDVQTMSYSTDMASTRAAFAATAMNYASFAKGLVSTTSYSTDQKMAAGDKFDGNANVQAVVAGKGTAWNGATLQKVSEARKASGKVDLGGGTEPKGSSLDVTL